FGIQSRPVHQRAGDVLVGHAALARAPGDPVRVAPERPRVHGACSAGVRTVRDLPLDVELRLVAFAELEALRHAVDAVDVRGIESRKRGDDAGELLAPRRGDAGEGDRGYLGGLERAAGGLARGAFLACALDARRLVLLLGRRTVEV